MRGIQNLVRLCALLILQTELVCGKFQILERDQGDSVDFSCHIPPRSPPPVGFSLKRGCLHSTDVIFKYTGNDFSADRNEAPRFSVSGDPRGHAVNVTISQLRPGDTDSYFCEFVAEKPSHEDEKIQAAEFFLLVRSDAPGSVDMELVQTCPGGSVVIPCVAPAGESASVEGFVLKRQKGRAPVEVAFHSKRHLGGGGTPSPSRFPPDRVQLSSVPGPGGITYNLTLQQLRPEDSALYGCQLLLRGRPHGSGLGTRVLFVSVQGGERSCSGQSSYPTLLYVLSAAVGVLLLLLLVVGVVVICKGKAQGGAKPPAPIYEEMVGVPGRKLPAALTDGGESSEYKNYQVKRSCPGNHYESPSGALVPRSDPLI